MSLISNIIIIIIFIWLISISFCLALFYKDYINFKYSKQAHEIVRKPRKGFVVPGSGIFTIKEKKPALVNDDKAAWIKEVNDDTARS